MTGGRIHLGHAQWAAVLEWRGQWEQRADRQEQSTLGVACKRFGRLDWGARARSGGYFSVGHRESVSMGGGTG